MLCLSSFLVAIFFIYSIQFYSRCTFIANVKKEEDRIKYNYFKEKWTQESTAMTSRNQCYWNSNFQPYIEVTSETIAMGGKKTLLHGFSTHIRCWGWWHTIELSFPSISLISTRSYPPALKLLLSRSMQSSLLAFLCSFLQRLSLTSLSTL